MKISPYTSYLELQPNALLVRQIFYYLQKVGCYTAPIDKVNLMKEKGLTGVCIAGHWLAG
jgi:hypothetical protein